MTPAPVIELCNIDTRFGDQYVHRGLSLSVAEGQIVGLLGGSGSGKTTLLREILGLLAPTAGCVRLFGVDLNEPDVSVQRNLRRRLGMLFQQGALFSALTVFENIAFPLRELKCLDEDWIRRLVHLKLSMVGLGAEHGRLHVRRHVGADAREPLGLLVEDRAEALKRMVHEMATRNTKSTKISP